jgi:hypothetical protein
MGPVARARARDFCDPTHTQNPTRIPHHPKKRVRGGWEPNNFCLASEGRARARVRTGGTTTQGGPGLLVIKQLALL